MSEVGQEEVTIVIRKLLTLDTALFKGCTAIELARLEVKLQAARRTVGTIRYMQDVTLKNTAKISDKRCITKILRQLFISGGDRVRVSVPYAMYVTEHSKKRSALPRLGSRSFSRLINQEIEGYGVKKMRIEGGMAQCVYEVKV